MKSWWRDSNVNASSRTSSTDLAKWSKKFDLPTFQPLTEAQHENKMMDAVGQAVAQAFIKSATVMGNTVHNAVVKTFAEGTFLGCMGPCYIQPDQMQYVPLEISMAAALSARNSQAGTSNRQTPLQMTTAASAGTSDPIYSTTPLIATTVQDGSASLFPKGGILLLGMVCIRISFLRHPRCSLMHRLLCR